MDSEDLTSEPKLQRANITYLFLFFLMSVLCLILANTGSKWLSKIINTSYTDSTSQGITLVSRCTFASFLFFLIHSLVTIGNPNLEDSCQFIFHISWPILHWFIFFALFIIFWFIPDRLFDIYIQFAYGCSAVYLLLQLIFLIDFFHMLNEKFVENEKQKPLLIATIVLSIISIVVFVMGYVLFKSYNRAIIALSINLGISLVLFMGSLVIEHGSIFTAALVAAYVAFLSFSGCLCAWPLSKGSGTGSMITTTIFALVTLFWAGYSAKSTSAQFGATCTTNDEERQFSLSFFHCVFALASVYVTMLTTNWAVQKNGDGEMKWAKDRGDIASWVNFASAWVSLILYAWTLLAPSLFRDRDFGGLTNQ
jgi:hypothetical protein